MIGDAPWYLLNTVIRMSLKTPTVKEETRHYSSEYSARLSVHSKDLVVNLMKLTRQQAIAKTLAKRTAYQILVCLICGLVFKV
jgi:hypothetical protein